MKKFESKYIFSNNTQGTEKISIISCINKYMPCFFDSLKGSLSISYTGEGSRIARDFYIPVLKKSSKYYRLSGYFSIESLTITAAGLAGLVNNIGHMKLVVGAHDLSPELIRAYTISRNEAKNLLEEMGQRIASGMESVEGIFETERLKALAWMLANGTLEIRVAIPKKTFVGRGNGIFHEKLLIMEDNDGCFVEATGSANETRQAYDLNGESLTVHMSWREGAMEYIEKRKRDFESIWDDKHPDYFVFPLPEAINRKLHERFWTEKPPNIDPEDPTVRFIKQDIQKIADIVPIANFISEIGYLNDFSHLGIGPVRLYPHQTYAADFVLTRFPYRCLLADEVGLGKTLEAGAIIKRLVEAGQVERILILTPKNVARQWSEELWYHFGLRFWYFESSPRKRFISTDGSEIILGQNESPFGRAGVDHLIVSWHYARRDYVKNDLLSSKRGFDLIVVDEAHAARKKRSINKIEATKLNELCMELSITSPHILLLSATPVQLHSVEALDLLRILGLGGPWVHEKDFEKFYNILRNEPSEIEDEEWAFALRMVQSFASRNMSPDEVRGVVDAHIPQALSEIVYKMLATGQNFGGVASTMKHKNVESLRKFIMSLSPMQWYMVRNTRKRLEQQGFKFPDRIVKEVEVKLSAEHSELLEKLDQYLEKYYALYEKLLSPNNKGTIGFVRSIYHQRFVSSFTAAYQTVKHRREFLDGLLSRDEESMRRVAEKILEEEEWEGDEDDFIDAMVELLEKKDVEVSIIREKEALAALEMELKQFAPDSLTISDPKLKAIKDAVSDLYHNKGRKVLVFSKYTDTVDAIHKYLQRYGFDPQEIALYTGAGGRIYDPSVSRYIEVGKEEVRKSLEGKTVGIVICTDAASEGLNLQAASAVINVDMPWNPARVEQRIGRVDRLGQKSSEVGVINIWYPDSIEARMYKALFDRKEIYQFVVGPAQEIFSSGLRKALDEGAKGEKLRKLVEETLYQIDNIKEDIARTQGTLSGAAWKGNESLDGELVDRLVRFVKLASYYLGLTTRIDDDRLYIENGIANVQPEIEEWNGASIVPGKPNALTPVHPIIKWLISGIKKVSDGITPRFNDKSYYVVKNFNRIGSLLSIDKDGIPEELNSKQVLDALDELFEYADGDIN